MVIFGRKVKAGALISVIIVFTLAIYFTVNYKQVKQNFMKGLNDGRAQKLKEDSAAVR